MSSQDSDVEYARSPLAFVGESGGEEQTPSTSRASEEPQNPGSEGNRRARTVLDSAATARSSSVDNSDGYVRPQTPVRALFYINTHKSVMWIWTISLNMYLHLEGNMRGTMMV